MKAKRILAIALAVLMALAAVPAAFAKTEEGEKEGTRAHEAYFNDPSTDTHFNFTDSEVPWVNRSTDTYNYIESGNAGDDASSSIITSEPVYMFAGESVSFQYWYSTEEDYDIFTFSVNGSAEFQGSGESNGWVRHTYTAPTGGTYTFKWEYHKDSVTDSGSDCVRLAYFSSSAHWHDYRERAALVSGGGGLMLAAEDSSVYAFGVRSTDQDDHPLYLRSSNAGVASSVCRVSATATVPSQDTDLIKYISFDYAVDCEANYDKLRFMIDGAEIESWSGTGDFNWHHTSYEVAPGTHTFTWEYRKDSSVDGGSDCACIDNISLVNYDSAFDRFCNFSNYLNPGTHAQLIFNTPAGSAGFATTQPMITNNNRYIDSTSSCFETMITMAQGEQFSFDYVVSSESYDHFIFSVNGEAKLNVSGWQDSSQKHYTFTAPTTRTYIFRWEYNKDASVSRGRDLVGIYNILYSGTYYDDIDAGDIDDMLNSENSEEHLEFIGGAGVGGWFMPYVTPGWDAVVSTNKYYEDSESSIFTHCHMNAGDKISFEYKVSGETDDSGTEDYDYLEFVITLNDETKERFTATVSDWDDYEYTFTESGTFYFIWSYRKDGSIDLGDDCALIDSVCITRGGGPVVFPDISDALNPDDDPTQDLYFSNEGTHPFTVGVYDGRTFARSGNQGVPNSTCVTTTGFVVTAVGTTVSFDYAISSEPNHDKLVFLIDGVEKVAFWGNEEGDETWLTYSCPVSSGYHEFTWKYVKDGSVNGGYDTCALDNVRFTNSGETPPEGIPGDVDGNGSVTVSDAIMALRCAMGIMTLTPEQFARADMDGSGTVTVSDAIMILRKAMGLL